MLFINIDLRDILSTSTLIRKSYSASHLRGGCTKNGATEETARCCSQMTCRTRLWKTLAIFQADRQTVVTARSPAGHGGSALGARGSAKSLLTMAILELLQIQA
jgi:hypothetical protein